MKFPHNTDSFANYLAGIAQIDDHRDYRAMLECSRASAVAPPAARVWLETEHEETPVGAASYLIEQDERAAAQEQAYDRETERKVAEHYETLDSMDAEREAADDHYYDGVRS